MDTSLITIIAAIAENGVIGRGNQLPWRLKADLVNFARLTTGHSIIIGRKTYESIPAKRRPLKERQSIVITGQPGYKAPGCTVAKSWEEAIARAESKEVFVIGGRAIYAMALPHACYFYLTRVHTRPEGDVYFPPFEENDWHETSAERHQKDADNEFGCTFFSLRRKERERA